MAKFVILLVCLSAFEAAYGLKCYSCESNKNAYCNDVPNLEKIAFVECGKPAITAQNIKPACLKVSTEDTITNLVNVTRKCILTQGSKDPCETPLPGLSNVANLKLLHCSSCDEDGCNSATFINAGIFTTLLGFLLTRYVLN